MQITRELLLTARKRLLEMHFKSGVGHIGGNLSSIDLMMCLYHAVLKDSDQFVLSKGHSAGALYTTLWSKGYLSDDDLLQFHKDNTRLSGHPPAKGIPQIPFATGSLGHGFSLAAGLALSKKLTDDPGHIYCITSDGEWNEGSTWEGLIFSCHQRLDNLTVIIDLNGLQGFGSTKDVADLSPLIEKLATFGTHCFQIDGHDPEAILNAINTPNTSGKPKIIAATTVKGKGVSYMEHKMEWHYLPMSEAQFHQAIQELR